MGLTTVQQQSTDVVTHHSCTIQQPCVEQAPMMAKECAGCGKRIVERFLLKALDIFWHEDCLKCGCCDCRLGEVGSTLYIKANLILCKRDYLRLFGNTGSCSACNKMIPAYEMVMRAKYNVYHLECFACFACQHRCVHFFVWLNNSVIGKQRTVNPYVYNHLNLLPFTNRIELYKRYFCRFCVGDKYYLCDNKILCPYDYEERLVFAGLADNPNLNLAHMKRQLNNLQVILFPCLTSNSMNGCKVWCEMDWCKLSPISSFSLSLHSEKHTISISMHSSNRFWVSVLEKVFVKREEKSNYFRTGKIHRCSLLLVLPSNPFKHQVSEVYRFEIANRK